MRTLKKIISRYMYLITFFSVTIILIITSYLLIITEQKRAHEAALKTFAQIGQVLDENRRELAEIEDEYRETCLHNAETIARIIEGDPDIMYDVEALKELAEITEVDEIHLFDSTGCIFSGTHPEYYGYTFDSGEQMHFFKPMLSDKSLQLVQDITPNTAEKKLMQYSALWNRDGDMIVQVGMEPVSVMKVTKKNELSYIFSLFCVSPEANYYAIDADSGKIVGTTVTENTEKTSDQAGLDFNDIKTRGDGFFTIIDGQESYCVFKKVDDNYLGRTIPVYELYRRIPVTILLLAACLTVIALILSRAATSYMNKYVVENIQNVNEKLHSIAIGNFDETIDIQSSLEFSELSNYLNIMIRSLMDNNKKMSYVLSKTNMYIGVYEYNHHMKKVHYTEYLPKILELDSTTMAETASDYSLFRAFTDRIRQNPVPGESGVFRLHESSEKYIKLEEINEHNAILGVAIDVTDEITRRRKIEFERDRDALTGLYNRRGLDSRLSVLFQKPEELGHSAFVMIDADGLKTVNDTCGHQKGDIYIKKIAEIISSFDSQHCVAARQSGDEFILFLYNYNSTEDLAGMIRELTYIQDHSTVCLDGNTNIPLSFSFGCSLTRPDTSYQELIREADKKMYENKRERKQIS